MTQIELAIIRKWLDKEIANSKSLMNFQLQEMYYV